MLLFRRKRKEIVKTNIGILLYEISFKKRFNKYTNARVYLDFDMIEKYQWRFNEKFDTQTEMINFIIKECNRSLNKKLKETYDITLAIINS